jgi:AraC-like DNA-binding protein
MLLERLLENLALRVEAFATCRVGSGWRLRLPPVDWVTLHFSVSGEGGVREDGGQVRPLPAGTLAVVPPHLQHSLLSGDPPYGEVDPAGSASPDALPHHEAGPVGEDDAPLLVVCGRIEVNYAGGIGVFDQLQELLVLDFSDDEAMRSTFAAIRFEADSDRAGSRAMTSALMQECLIRILRELCMDDRCAVPWLDALDDPTLAPVIQAMIDRPESPHTVESLARMAYMSRSAFAKRFRERFGEPPLRYLRGVRLRHASSLLKKVPPLPVATIARRSGFSSRSQFSRAFSQYFGCPPSEYRG